MRPETVVFHPFPFISVFMAFCTVNLTLRISKLRILCALLLYDIIPNICVLFVWSLYFFLIWECLWSFSIWYLTHTRHQKSKYLPPIARNLTKSEHKFCIALMLLFIFCTRMKLRKICIFFRYLLFCSILWPSKKFAYFASIS